MAADESSRHDLFTRLEEVLGKEHAAVLMAHLPPVGWADVATKQDLEHLRVVMDARFEASEERVIGTLRAEINNQTRILFLGLATAFVGVAGVALAAAQLG